MEHALAQRLLWDKRKDLVTRLERLNEEMEAGQRDTVQELSSVDNHPADLGSETYEREKDLGLRETLRGNLRAVDAALHRLEEGSFGLCAHCSEPIADARLEVIPEAEYCVHCQQHYEHHSAGRQRPGEEDVLDPRFKSRPSPAYDPVDTWEDAAQHGTSYSPQDQATSPGYEDIHREEEPDAGTVERVEKAPRRRRSPST